MFGSARARNQRSAGKVQSAGCRAAVVKLFKNIQNHEIKQRSPSSYNRERKETGLQRPGEAKKPNRKGGGHSWKMEILKNIRTVKPQKLSQEGMDFSWQLCYNHGMMMQPGFSDGKKPGVTHMMSMRLTYVKERIDFIERKRNR